MHVSTTLPVAKNSTLRAIKTREFNGSARLSNRSKGWKGNCTHAVTNIAKSMNANITVTVHPRTLLHLLLCTTKLASYCQGAPCPTHLCTVFSIVLSDSQRYGAAPPVRPVRIHLLS